MTFNKAVEPEKAPPPTCRKCGEPVWTKYYQDIFGVICVTGWCKCADENIQALIFPDWHEVYTSDRPQIEPLHADSVCRCERCGMNVLGTQRFIKSGGGFWSQGSGLCGCTVKETYEQIEARWKEVCSHAKVNRRLPGLAGMVAQIIDGVADIPQEQSQ